MSISSDHVTGFVVGVGVAALGFYVYKKNEGRSTNGCAASRSASPGLQAKDQAGESLEELLREKERLEDLIAEREMAEKSKTQAAPAPA